MLFSTLVLALSAVSPSLIEARPTQTSNLDLGRGIQDLAYLANLVKYAYVIPQASNLTLTSSDVYQPDQPSSSRRKLIDQRHPRSEDGPGCKCHIQGSINTHGTGRLTHDSHSDIITLAFSSPPPEILLEILASSDPSDSDYLVPLPHHLLLSNNTLHPRIYAPYVEYFDILEEALDSVHQYITHPPTYSSFFSIYLAPISAYFGFPYNPTPRSIDGIEIIGHGLGSVLALLSTLAIHKDHPYLNIEATMFSMPQMGDEEFGRYVDRLVWQSGHLNLRRITHGKDVMPTLPPTHYGLDHPASILDVILLQENGRAWDEKPNLKDGLGPYMGQYIGRDR
jgi:hypothetical protein